MPTCSALNCTRAATRTIKGFPVCAECRSRKSIEVIRVELRYQMDIESILRAVIQRFDTWGERYKVLGVSKVAMFGWVRKYLDLTPQQAVAEIHDGKKCAGSLQTGVRDYLTTKILIVPV